MTGKLFEIQSGKIIPKDDCWIIQPLKRIIDEYPDDYGKIFAYLHYMKSMKQSDNPYADVPIEERNETIMRDLHLYIDEESQIIKDGLECVEGIYATTFYRIYKGIKEYMDKVGTALQTITPDFNKKDGNADTVRAFIKDYQMLSNNYKKAYRDFDEEQGNLRVRGGQRLSYDEDDD